MFQNCLHLLLLIFLDRRKGIINEPCSFCLFMEQKIILLINKNSVFI